MSLKSIATAACPRFLQPWWRRLWASPLAGRLSQAALWSLLGAGASRGLALLGGIAVARFLGREGFGQLGILLSTVQMFGILAGFGLGLTAAKHIAECRQADPLKAGRILALSGVSAVLASGLAAVLLVALAPWLASQTLAAPHLQGPLRLSAALLFFTGLTGAQAGVLSSFEAFKTLAWINCLAGALGLPLLILATHWGRLQGALGGFIAWQAAAWCLGHFAIRRQARQAGVRFLLRGCRSELPILWKFTLPAVLSAAMVAPVNWACNALLVHQPQGYAQVGLFNAANQWFNALQLLPVVLGQAFLPILAERHGAGDHQRTGRILLAAFRLNLLTVLPVVLLLCLLSPWVMSCYGPDFRQGWSTLVLVLVTAGLLAGQTPAGQFIVARGRMWLGFCFNLGWAVAFLLSTTALVALGALGLATARLLAYVLHTLWTCGYVLLYYRRHPLGAPKELLARPEEVGH